MCENDYKKRRDKLASSTHLDIPHASQLRLGERLKVANPLEAWIGGEAEDGGIRSMGVEEDAHRPSIPLIVPDADRHVHEVLVAVRVRPPTKRLGDVQIAVDPDGAVGLVDDQVPVDLARNVARDGRLPQAPPLGDGRLLDDWGFRLSGLLRTRGHERDGDVGLANARWWRRDADLARPDFWKVRANAVMAFRGFRGGLMAFRRGLMAFRRGLRAFQGGLAALQKGRFKDLFAFQRDWLRDRRRTFLHWRAAWKLHPVDGLTRRIYKRDATGKRRRGDGVLP